jgi:hypothetical protein
MWNELVDLHIKSKRLSTDLDAAMMKHESVQDIRQIHQDLKKVKRQIFSWRGKNLFQLNN